MQYLIYYGVGIFIEISALFTTVHINPNSYSKLIDVTFFLYV